MAKRWRAGRPRKKRKRYPGGQLWHERAGPTNELIAQRTRLVGAEHALRDDAEWYVGRLFLKGIVNEHQREAAKQWGERIRRYEALLCAPRKLRALTLDLPMGETPDNPDEFLRVKTEYETCYDAVRSKGYTVLRATVGALREEEHHRIELVREGLEALRIVLGIGDYIVRRKRGS